MDARQIIDFAADDNAKEMREALYASIYDRVSNAIEVKKQEVAHTLLGMPLSTEEVQLEEGEEGCDDHEGKEGHEDEVADKKLVKKMVKKDALKSND